MQLLPKTYKLNSITVSHPVLKYIITSFRIFVFCNISKRDIIPFLFRENYYFMFDGQTIILEDYFEIRPEKKEFLLNFIRNRRIEVGPWYLLPDEWLVGQESLIRNLETSIDLARQYEIPLMQIAYLPDQFGHSRAIPQLISDLTSFETAMVWRGVGPEVVTVPFKWRSSFKVFNRRYRRY